MYDEVDEIEGDIDASQTAPKLSPSQKLQGLGVIGAALLTIFIVFSHQETDIEPDEVETSSEIYAIYTKALSEPQPALRRARLLDFVENYADHDRVDAAKAQLSVIQNADDQDWLSVQEIIFDPRQIYPAKLAALGLYEDIWSPVLLGGREDEVETLKSRLESGEPIIEVTEPTDNTEDFTPPPDTFDASIDGTQLAGGVTVSRPVALPPPPRVVQTPTPRQTAVIAPARIRKDRRPSYPSRAARKGVEAEIVLILSIDEDGEVQTTEVISAQARRYRKDFIRAAERAALRTRYHPKTINGRPVPSTGIIKKYVFKME